MKRVFLTAMLAAAGLFCGCGTTEPVVFAEVLQQKLDEKVYTACNIWYTDANAIDCANIQQGSFIPLGTEVEPVSTSDDGKITFRAKDKTFTILFDEGTRLCTMRDFIGEFFTTTPPEKMLENIPEKITRRIVRGEVVPGMDRKAVLLAYGPPPAIRTPSAKNETWIYYIAPGKTIRLVFRGDVVRSILDIDL